jgi:hypothetical protein
MVLSHFQVKASQTRQTRALLTEFTLQDAPLQFAPCRKLGTGEIANRRGHYL